MNTPNNVVLQFLQEMFLRFSTKSPVFFKVFQVISGAFVLIVGIPEFLTMFNIHLPQLFNDAMQKLVSGASTGMLFVSLLTNKSKLAGIDTSGNILTSTNEKKLPFTDTQEKKAILKEENVKEMSVSAIVNPSDSISKP